jgi:DNA-binding beta-propeller fold protein YncE
VRAIAAVALGLAGVAAPAHWTHVATAPGIVDVVKLYGSGQLVVSTRDGLFEVHGAQLRAFATYKPNEGGEQYAAVVPALRSGGCTWQRNDIFVIDASATPGVVRVPHGGTASRFAELPKGEFPSGITWDSEGAFGHRLLVTTVLKENTNVYAIDCSGRTTVIRLAGPRVEGGIVVAPRGFGRFGRRLLAANELNGTIYAFDAKGRNTVVATPPVRVGGDLGIESLGFSPGPSAIAYLADLGAPNSPTKGTDSLLKLATKLPRGTLVAVAEGGATTVSITCKKACTARQIADGPARTHSEGHVTYAPSQ